jgi:hypothetical protein
MPEVAEEVWDKPLTPYMKGQIVWRALRHFVGHPENLGVDNVEFLSGYTYQNKKDPNRMCILGWQMDEPSLKFALRNADAIQCVFDTVESRENYRLDEPEYYVTIPEAIYIVGPKGTFAPDFEGTKVKIVGADIDWWSDLQDLHDTRFTNDRCRVNHKTFMHIEQKLGVRMFIPKQDAAFYDYVKRPNLELNSIYRVQARNFDIAIWRGEDEGGFQGIREKFGKKFPDFELHWDSCENHGTAKPLYRCYFPMTNPPAINDNEGLLNYLRDRERECLPKED